MTWHANAEVDLQKVRITNSNQSIELEEIHNALSNFSRSEDKVNAKEVESSQMVKSNKKTSPATAQKKKTKTKKIN